MVWPCGTKFLAEKIDQKIVIFRGHGDKKLHFFTKNGRNVTWMGSNGYIYAHNIPKLCRYFTGGAEKIDFQGVQNCKNDENRKNDDFLVKIFFTENRILLLRLAFGMTQ